MVTVLTTATYGNSREVIAQQEKVKNVKQRFVATRQTRRREHGNGATET